MYNFSIQRDIQLVDFNPFSPTTDAILFSWSELADGTMNTGKEGAPVIRVVEDASLIRPSDLHASRLPRV